MKISLGALLVSIVPCFTLIACGDKKSPDTDLAAPASTEDTLARERVAAHFRGNRLPQARTALAPLLAGSTPALEDLVRAAAIELADSRLDALAPILERGLARAAAHPALRYMRAQLALQTGQLEAALADLQVARAGAPGDLPTALHLAAALYDLGRGPEAEPGVHGVENATLNRLQAISNIRKSTRRDHREGIIEVALAQFVRKRKLLLETGRDRHPAARFLQIQ